MPDDKVFPTRGQLVIVRAPWVAEGKTRLGPGGVYDYIIPRPKSGHVVLGGCAEKNNWCASAPSPTGGDPARTLTDRSTGTRTRRDPKPRPDMARRIKERCLALCPELLPPDKRGRGTIDDLDVVEDAVGLRPTREGGIRLEADRVRIEGEGRDVPVVHHYGHGGYGYQSSWGSAEAAAELVKAALSSGRSKL